MLLDDLRRADLRRIARWLVPVLTVLPVLAAAGILLQTPRVVDLRYGSDTFMLLDGAWRLVVGQRQHVDFHCPYGVFQHALFAAGLRLVGPDVRAIPVTVAVWSLVVFLWAYLLAAARLRPALASGYALLVAATAIGQNQLGFPYSDLSHAAYYNRIGFVFLLVLAVALRDPVRSGGVLSEETHRRFGGFSCGLALAGATFTKASYAAVMLGLLGAVYLWRRRGRGFWIAAGVGAVAGVLALAPSIGWRFDRMVSDYLFAATTRASYHDLHFDLAAILGTLSDRHDIRLTWPRFVEVLSQEYLDIAALGMVVLAVRGARPLDSWRGRAVVFVAGTTAAIFLVLGNWQWAGCPLLPALALLFAQSASVPSVGIPARALAVAIAVPHLAVAAASVLYLPPAANAFRGAKYESRPLSALLTSGRENPCDTERFAERVEEVADLVRRLPFPPRVATLDLSNPYPFATQTTPPRGTTVGLQVDATFREDRIDASAVLGDANVVVLHRCAFSVPTAIALDHALRGQLEATFTTVELPHALVYVKP